MTEHQERTLSAALGYVQLGWPVLPLWSTRDGQCLCQTAECKANGTQGKHPFTKLVPHGLTDASKDPDVVRAWFSKGLDLNIGVVAGKVSGTTVIDVDPRHGGLDSLKAIPPIPDTARQRTGGDGFHHVMDYAEGVKSGANRLGPGLDIRNDGSYFVAAPSIHVSGKEYVWEVDPRAGLAKVPAGILALLNGHAAKTVTQTQAGTGDVIPVGSRNKTLLSMAGTMRRRGFGQDAINAALLEENKRCGVMEQDKFKAVPLDPGEVGKIANSVAKYDPAEVPQDQAEPLVAVSALDLLVTEPAEADQVMTDCFDRGDKVCIIGSSKLRKSFFLLQGCLSLATGREFLGWQVPKARRVLLCQLEIQQSHFHRRVRRMASGLGVTPEDIGDRFHIVHGRGLGLSGKAGMERVMELAKTLEPEIVCIDPWYKFHDGVENRAEDVKVTLDLFDQLAEVTGASVLFIHHDAKGQPGDRPIQDRGSGSGVLARDYDWAVTLTPHASEEDTTVIETLTRNYRPQDAFCIGWWDDVNGMAYRFDLRPEVAPTKKTSATRTQELAGFEVVKPLALSLIRDKEIDIAEFRETIRTKAGYGRDRVQRFTAWFIKTSEDPAIEVYEVRGKGKHTKFIGTKEQIDRLRGIS